MSEPARRAVAALLLGLAVALGGVAPARADEGCGDGAWSEHALASDSGVGGTGVAGDDSGVGGTGARGGDSGTGGTGIFGTITERDGLCVNGERVQLSADVEVVLEKGRAVGAENLFAGQTVWLVAEPGPGGFAASKVWVLPGGHGAGATRAWLEERIASAGPLAAVSIEGRVERWLNGDRFELGGLVVQAPDARDVLGAAIGSPRVRVRGTLGRDGLLRADRIAIQARPSPRPPRPVDRPPRLDRPDTRERPVRPDGSLRPNRSDRPTTTR